MPEQGVAGAAGYRAFISYSHRDDAVAKTLHRRLETYRLPKKLIGAPGERGPIPARLTPIFRDLDELSAADDLSVEIKAALARSEVLIILCSPGAKASKWVNLEIETFRALHGGSRPVLAALIEGEPAEAFPPALTAEGHEPVAADFRKSRDGKRLALLKLVAGIAGAPLDALVQRDAQRQNRRVMAITGGALAAALTMALLLVVALRSQAEAQRQRAEAEGLVEYMLTDLRDKLKGVGRLDVMTAVNERAMQYYGGDTVKGQLLKARTLHALGEDDDTRGNLEAAAQKFDEAHQLTETLIANSPENPDAILARAESEYWIGYLNQKRKRYKTANQNYSNQVKYLTSLIKNDNKAKSLMSVGLKALGILNFSDLNDKHAALVYFKDNQKLLASIKYTNNNRTSLAFESADAHAWLADSYAALNDYQSAKGERQKQAVLIDSLLNVDPLNKRYIWAKIGSDRAIFRICYKILDNKCAANFIYSANKRLSSTPYDSNDSSWRWMAFYVALDEGFMALRNRQCNTLSTGKIKILKKFTEYAEHSPKNITEIKDMKISLDYLFREKCRRYLA